MKVIIVVDANPIIAALLGGNTKIKRTTEIKESTKLQRPYR